MSGLGFKIFKLDLGSKPSFNLIIFNLIPQDRNFPCLHHLLAKILASATPAAIMSYIHIVGMDAVLQSSSQRVTSHWLASTGDRYM